MKEDELSYSLPDGRLIFTAEYLLRKRACCKSSCLHCPYGHTLKNFGLKFRPYHATDDEKIHSILACNGFSVDYVSSLLSAASGMKKKTFDIKNHAKNMQVILMKDFICGFIVIENNAISQFYLDKHFKKQGLDLATVQAYFKS
jgi:hypothetical protein